MQINILQSKKYTKMHIPKSYRYYKLTNFAALWFGEFTAIAGRNSKKI